MCSTRQPAARKGVQATPVPGEPAGLGGPGAVVLDRDPPIGEGQVGAGHETAPGVPDHLPRRRRQPGPPQHQPQPFRPRPAYDRTVETSVHLAPDAVGQGLGRKLYTALFEVLADQDVHRALAVIAQPNPASEALHRAFGFVRVGTFGEVGHKFGRFVDVSWFQKDL